MFKNIFIVLIWSEHYRALADWYREKLGLIRLDEIHHIEQNRTTIIF